MTVDTVRRAPVWQDWPVLGSEWPGCVVTIGVFDGFHRGHVALVRAAQARGGRLGLPTVLMTFSPHPLTVTCPSRAPRLLMGVEERVESALSLGVDGVVVLPFTRALAAVPAESFVSAGLVGALGARTVVVGENFRCGRGGAGDVSYLRTAGERHGFDVETVGLVRVGDRTCSSTEVRRALARGDVPLANLLLGHDVESALVQACTASSRR